MVEINSRNRRGVLNFIDSVSSGEGGVEVRSAQGSSVKSKDLFYPPSSGTKAKSWYGRALRRSDNDEEMTFIKVYEWMKMVLGPEEIQLHDMILFPIQVGLDDLRPLFVAAGYDLDKPFLNKSTSLAMMKYIANRNASGEYNDYLALVMNLSMTPRGVEAQNVVQIRPWEHIGQVVIGRYLVENVRLNGILSEIGRLDDGAYKINVIETLTEIVDPMVVFDSYVLTTGDEPIRQYAEKQLLVGKIWGFTQPYIDQVTGQKVPRDYDYGQFALDMIRMERGIRMRGENGMIELFKRFYIGSTGFGRDHIFPYITLARPGVDDNEVEWNMIYVAFISIYFGDGHTWLVKLSADANTYYYLLEQAMLVWRRQNETLPDADVNWGGELVYDAIVHDHQKFPSTETAPSSHLDTDRGMRVIVGDVPNGIVPATWIDEALIRARSDRRVYKQVTVVLKRYGLLDVKSTHVVTQFSRWGAEPLPPMSVSDLIGVGNLFAITKLLKRNMAIGAPLPKPEIVEKYWSDTAKTELTTWLRTTVGGAVDRLYRPNQ